MSRLSIKRIKIQLNSSFGTIDCYTTNQFKVVFCTHLRVPANIEIERWVHIERF